MEKLLEGIIRWLTETPYPNPRNKMPSQYQELHKQQSTIGWDQMLHAWAMENPTTPAPAQQQHIL
jgi:hypothetical protein